MTVTCWPGVLAVSATRISYAAVSSGPAALGVLAAGSHCTLPAGLSGTSRTGGLLPSCARTRLPFRVSILDNVAREAPPSWATRATLNPGPHQFHSDAEHFKSWARKGGYYFCRLSDVRELMRPVPLPDDRWGLCDANHRQATRPRTRLKGDRKWP